MASGYNVETGAHKIKNNLHCVFLLGLLLFSLTRRTFDVDGGIFLTPSLPQSCPLTLLMIKWSELLVKHNKSELYEWGELVHSPVSEAQRRRAGGRGGSHSRVGIRLPTEIS